LTKEPVVRALNTECQQWLGRKRAVGVISYAAKVIEYHQTRNAAAMRSRRKFGAKLAL
jgi:hypothetical protein